MTNVEVSANQDRKVKMVIVVRRDLRNSRGEKCRSGKICAQTAHAAIGAYKRADKSDEAFKKWDQSKFTKICLGVDSAEELMQIFDAAVANSLNAVYIVDAGDTEFDGIPTLTCMAIGPSWEDEIDKVTGNLKLY